MRPVALFLGSSLLAAQAPEEPAQDPLLRLLETPILAASKSLQAPVEAPARVIVITAEDIRLRGYQDLEELLRSGGPGRGWQDVYRRGASAALPGVPGPPVPVLVIGVPPGAVPIGWKGGQPSRLSPSTHASRPST